MMPSGKSVFYRKGQAERYGRKDKAEEARDSGERWQIEIERGVVAWRSSEERVGLRPSLYRSSTRMARTTPTTSPCPHVRVNANDSMSFRSVARQECSHRVARARRSERGRVEQRSRERGGGRGVGVVRIHLPRSEKTARRPESLRGGERRGAIAERHCGEHCRYARPDVCHELHARPTGSTHDRARVSPRVLHRSRPSGARVSSAPRAEVRVMRIDI